MKYTSGFFFLVWFLLQSSAYALTPDQFKKLAHMMVTDLEKAYGESHLEKGILFDFREYHKLIDTTKIHPSSKPKPLTNQFFDQNQQKVLTETVDAINYFPAKKEIEYDDSAWQEKFNQSRWKELKLMIHHEFVPYFKKASDRERSLDDFLKEIYKVHYGFEDIRAGFYKVISSKEPLFKSLNDYYIIFIAYDARAQQLMMLNIENPLKKTWCLDCYVHVNPSRYNIDDPQADLARLMTTPFDYNPQQLIPNFVGGRGGLTGYAFMRVFNDNTLGLGVEPEDFKQPLSELMNPAREESKVVILSRMKDVDQFDWSGPKTIPILGFFLDPDKGDCDGLRKKLISQSVIACRDLRKMKVDIYESWCRKENIVVQDLKEYPFYDRFKCALFTYDQVPTNPNFYPISRDYFDTVVAGWKEAVKLHLQVDRIPPKQ
jgi:hypothetical protein